MTTTERLLSEFAAAWRGGDRPRVEAYLARAAPERRAALAAALGDWLAAAPAPPYDEAARAALRAEPALREVFAALERDDPG